MNRQINHHPLQGRVALVTGAGGTMGRAAQGCRVGLVDLRRDAMRATEARFCAVVHAVACDIGDAGAVAVAHAEVVEALGRVDILVNNAGVLTNHKLLATTTDDWRRVMAANLDGALFWSQAVVPAMKAAGWGRIVNVSSLAAKQIPVGRFCEPEEFAHVVCFLASPLSGFITGEVIDLNGGLLMD
jgi:3-oxoacyl-[acyl-carrier protein] reductase